MTSLDPGEGAVAVSLYPWEIALAGPDTVVGGSAQNHLPVEVVAVTEVGNRVRVGLASPQPLSAEVTAAAVDQLGLRPGVRAVATWKAAATRLLAL